MTVNEMTVNEMTVNEMTVNEMTVNEMTVNEMNVDEMTVDKMTFDDLTCCPFVFNEQSWGRKTFKVDDSTWRAPLKNFFTVVINSVR